MYKNEKWRVTKEQQKELIENLTKELASLRVKVGISQDELSKVIGISRQTYCSIESGKSKMTWGTYLSLITFFDYNNPTHQLIRSIRAFPEEIVMRFNDGEKDSYTFSKGIAGIPEDITDKLDDYALHTIRTVVMLEYARCAKMTGEEVVKSFEGTTIKQTLCEIDYKTNEAIKKIREAQSNK